MKISETQYKFNDEMIGAHSGQLDMRLSLKFNGEEVGYIDYVVFEGVPSISMIEVTEKGKSYGTLLVKKLQEMYPDEEIEWGYTTPEGEALRNSLRYKRVPSEHYEDFKLFHKYKGKREYYQDKADSLWNKESLTDEDKKTLRRIGSALNVINDKISDYEDLLYNEKPYKNIIV